MIRSDYRGNRVSGFPDDDGGFDYLRHRGLHGAAELDAAPNTRWRGRRGIWSMFRHGLRIIGLSLFRRCRFLF